MFNIPSGAIGSQFLFAGIRFTLAGILTILFGSILSKKILVPKKESLFSVFKLSMVQTVLAVCVFLHRLGEYIRRKIFYYKCRKRISFNIIRSIHI